MPGKGPKPIVVDTFYRTHQYVCSVCIYYNKKTSRCNHLEHLDERKGAFHPICGKFVKQSDFYRES